LEWPANLYHNHGCGIITQQKLGAFHNRIPDLAQVPKASHSPYSLHLSPFPTLKMRKNTKGKDISQNATYLPRKGKGKRGFPT
jgi:hypothetical protein